MSNLKKYFDKSYCSLLSRVYDTEGYVFFANLLKASSHEDILEDSVELLAKVPNERQQEVRPHVQCMLTGVEASRKEAMFAYLLYRDPSISVDTSLTFKALEEILNIHLIKRLQKDFKDSQLRFVLSTAIAREGSTQEACHGGIVGLDFGPETDRASGRETDREPHAEPRGGAVHVEHPDQDNRRSG